MQPRLKSNTSSHNNNIISEEFNDNNLQEPPLKLPRLTINNINKQTFKNKSKDYGIDLPKLKEKVDDQIDNLDGSEDLNQSQNYANSSDNIRDQINDIKRKMNLSKYSENFMQLNPTEQQLKQKHSGSSTYIRNGKINQRSNKGSIDDKRSNLKSQVNNEENRTLITDTNKIDSDISDFEQKIQANRVIIKNNKFIKKNKQDKEQSAGKKINLFEKKMSNNPQQIIYQKRMKQYKNLSENKYLKQKKKQVKQIALNELKSAKPKVQDINSKQKQIKNIRTPSRSKRQSPSLNSQARRPQTNKKLHLVKRRKSKFKQQILDESSSNYPVSENLFADINMILGKKHKSRSQFLSVGKLSSLSGNPNAKPKHKINLNIKQLQQSFRMLQQQQSKLLGYKKNPQNLKVEINKSLIDPSNLFQWQRVVISDNCRQLNIIQSDFINQVDRIDSFHQKNQQSLEAYIANRELLIELQLQQKMKELSPMKARTDILQNSYRDY